MKISNPNPNPVPGNLRDPFVLYHPEDDLYYLTATSPPFWPGTGDNCGVRLWASPDLMNWEDCGLMVDASAMADNVWCRHRFWAPEMFIHKGVYYLLFSCQNESTEEGVTLPLGMFLAKSDNIRGPYTLYSVNEPVLAFGIDGNLFCDADGKVYLTYAWGGIHMCEFDLEAGKPLTEPKPIVMSGEGEDWDAHPYTEGNFLVHRNGLYYLWYSNPKTSYEMGIAVTKSLDKPFTKLPGNPIVSGVGTPIHYAGHNSCFTLRGGGDAIAFHGHNTDEPERLCVMPVSYPPVPMVPPDTVEI